MKKSQSRFWKNLHPLIRRKRKPMYEDDTHFAILNAIDESLKDLEAETIKSKIQSSLKTATGIFLDEYGHFFGVRRKLHRDESDDKYRTRIIGSLDIPRGTNESIVRGIHRFLEDNTIDIEVREPWKNMMFLNNPKHKMNGTHRFQGEYQHFAIINVYIGTPLEAVLYDVIKEYKPAGVKFYITYDPNARPGKGDLWGEIDYPEYYPKKWENLTEVDNVIHEPMNGFVSIDDTIKPKEKFILNSSRFGEKKVLLGEYETLNPKIHLAGVQGDFTPHQYTRLSDVLHNLELVGKDFYENRGPDNPYSVQVSNKKYLYAIMNVGTAIENTYPEFGKRDRIHEEIVSEAEMIFDYSSETYSDISLEIFDFRGGSWEEIFRGPTRTEISKKHVPIPKEVSTLNGDNLMFIRLRSSEEVKLSLGRVKLEYTSDVVLNKTGPKLSVMAGEPLEVDDLTPFSNVLDRAIVGYATTTTQMYGLKNRE